MFSLYQKSEKVSPLPQCQSLVNESSSKAVTRCNHVPNLYYNFDMSAMLFDGLLDFLSASEQVTSLLVALEAVWTWTRYPRDYCAPVFPRINIPLLLTKLTEMVERRGWSLLPSQFSEYTFGLNNSH